MLGTPVNRGAGTQADVSFTPVIYDQYVEDIHIPQTVASVAAGASVIHQEVGIWMIQPPTNDGPASVIRHGSLPHGVAFVAEGPYSVIAGAPVIPPVSLLPFDASGAPVNKVPFTTVSAPGTNIPQAVLGDPNKLLRDANTGLNITSTTVLQVDTAIGGGIAQTNFLKKNALVTRLRATFYLETVSTWFGPSPRIQYFQEVFIQIEDLIYPHVTVATLTLDPLPEPVLI